MLRFWLLIPLLLSLAAPRSLEAARCAPRDDDVQTPWRSLSWEDYRAKMSPRASSDAAKTRTGLVLKNEEIAAQAAGDEWVARLGKVCVYATMYKLESGFAANGKNPRNLAHGQLRFDITEVFARRLYWRVAALEVRGPEPGALREELRGRVKQAYRELLQQWIGAMELHSRETDFGRKKLGQRKWKRRVQEWLAEAPPIP